MQLVDPRRFGLQRVDRFMHMARKNTPLCLTHRRLHVLQLISQLTVQRLLVEELGTVLLEQALEHAHFSVCQRCRCRCLAQAAEERLTRRIICFSLAQTRMDLGLARPVRLGRHTQRIGHYAANLFVALLRRV